MYFEEYRDSLGIPADLVSYDRAGIVVTLSASAKSLKTQAKDFLDRIGSDLAYRYPGTQGRNPCGIPQVPQCVPSGYDCY